MAAAEGAGGTGADVMGPWWAMVRTLAFTPSEMGTMGGLRAEEGRELA